MIPSVKTRERPCWEWDSENHVNLTLKYLRINQMAMSIMLTQVRGISIIIRGKEAIMAIDADIFSDLVVGS